MHRTLHTFASGAFGWYDTAETILLIDLHATWTWEEAAATYRLANQRMAAQPHPVYCITYGAPGVSLVPHGNLPLRQLRQIISADTSPEQLTVFVGMSVMVNTLIEMTARVYQLWGQVSKYRYADTLAEALTIIAAHREQHTPQMG